MNNKLFLERTELQIITNEITLNFIYPKDFNISDNETINGLELNWNYKSVNEEPNEFNIEIKGLSTTTISKIKLRNNVRLIAGYSGDIGEIASGIISKKELEKGVLKLKCREVPIEYKKIVSTAFAPNTTAKQIIESLANDINMTIKQIELKKDIVYTIGESIIGSGLYEIGQIVRDCESKMTIKNDFIYIYHNELKDEKVISLSYKSGLLEEPKQKNIEEINFKPTKPEKTKETKEEKQELQYDYEVKCLLIHYLKKGDLIELISNEISTEARIVEISDISDFVMTLKILVVNGG